VRSIKGCHCLLHGFAERTLRGDFADSLPHFPSGAKAAYFLKSATAPYPKGLALREDYFCVRHGSLRQSTGENLIEALLPGFHAGFAQQPLAASAAHGRAFLSGQCFHG
jgi:hypothetical protein